MGTPVYESWGPAAASSVSAPRQLLFVGRNGGQEELLSSTSAYRKEYLARPGMKERLRLQALANMQRPGVRDRKLAYMRAYNRRRRLDPQARAKDRLISRRWYLENKYGLSTVDAEALLAQDCAVCGTSRDLVIDHIHNEEPNVRGVLCRTCNLVVGHFEPNPYLFLAAFQYLSRKAGAAIDVG